MPADSDTATKSCPYCKAEIAIDAVRCRHCTSWLDEADAPAAASAQKVVYILDRGLIRFGKFVTVIFGLFLLAGAYLWGLDMKETDKNLKDMEKEVRTVRDDIAKDKRDVDGLKQDIVTINKDAKAASQQAISAAEEIASRAQETRGQFDFVLVKVREEITKDFWQVLAQEQYDRLLVRMKEGSPAPASSKTRQYSADELLDLVKNDVRKAVAFYKTFGIDMAEPPAKIDKDPNFTNAYWDGHTIVYGMAMANGPIFGPYSSTIVFHEATLALFSIPFEGQSGAVAESIPDVIAVLIARDSDGNTDWTIGSVRNGDGPPQPFHSLRSPGGAYENPVLGKDAQVDHMRRLYTGSQDNGGIHINSGILNKAAYLMAEGGDFHGVHIERGIGPDKLAKLYMGVIKKLRSQKSTALDFVSFKTLVLGTATEELVDAGDRKTVGDAFRAVGL
jgi:hypothetical protein